ncbi:ArnT family glycosyltransferase [Halomicrococcus sp. NG-SE-24]|uniref:ArnT family glycosyltransferase n=1 Tax=Halomicrococcus sp. NG-SE-24 TaxID=3436928 RepID=UPI003D9964E3
MAGDSSFTDRPTDEREQSRLEQAASSIAAALTRDRVWLGIALVVAAVVVGLYYRSHPYPAYGAGLYLSIAEEILAHGYRPPMRISGYTAEGVPFVYPPVGFYVTAVLLDVGVDPMTLTRFLPGVVSTVAVIPFYYLAREILGSTPRAGVTASIFAATPVVLQWHISAGGIVRSPAFLFTLTGLYCGIRLFRGNHRRWLAPAAILFGLTLLTHPTYTVFFGASYVLVWLFYDRSSTGLVAGAAVATGGLVIASPWIAYTVSTHGLEIFAGAAGTHGGLVQTRSPFRVLSELGRPIAAGRTMSLWYLLTLLGGGYLIARRRFFIPAWFLVSIVLLHERRFAFVPGTMAIGALMTAPRHLGADETYQYATRWLLRGVTAGLVVLLVAMGGFYAVGTPLHGGTSQPSFVDEEDATAMEWVDEELPADADFVVAGDAAEWFPYLSDRTILVGPWGVEWNSPAAYRHHLQTYRRLSHCHAETCLSKQLRRADVRPDYVYVPKGTYTVRGIETQQRPRMRRSLVRSDDYRLVYENRGVMIFRVR